MYTPKVAGMLCFECLNPADHAHHVIPRSLGGKKTVPLCESCHGKVHAKNFMNTGNLIRLGQQRAKERGQKLGAPQRIDREQVRQLRLTGLSVRKIAKIMGVAFSSVHKILKELGLGGKVPA